jgi:hypothetical protein
MNRQSRVYKATATSSLDEVAKAAGAGMLAPSEAVIDWLP